MSWLVALLVGFNICLLAHNEVAVRSLHDGDASWLQTPRGVIASEGAGRRTDAQAGTPAGSTFVVGGSIEEGAAVAGALRSLGLRPAANSSAWDADLIWPSPLLRDSADFFDERLLRRPQVRVRSMLGLAETIGSAGVLGHALQLCTAQHGFAACSFAPPIYTLPRQTSRWREAVRSMRSRLWIVKGRRQQRQGGRPVGPPRPTRILSSREALPSSEAGIDATLEGGTDGGTAGAGGAGGGAGSGAGGGYHLQPYIARPLLWHGQKHDIRLWALVTSARPLRLFLLQDGWARIAARPYDASALAANTGDHCMHLTTARCEELDGEALLQGDSSGMQRLLRLNTAAYRRGLAAPESFATEQWAAIERAVVQTVLLSAPVIDAYEGMLRAYGAAYRRFAFLSLDVLVDEEGRPHVTDVDIDTLDPTSPPTLPSAPQYLAHAFALLGLRGYPRRGAYAARTDAAIAALCTGGSRAPSNLSSAAPHPPGRGPQVECETEEIAAMQQLADESEHAGQFARVFPPSTREESRALGPLADAALDGRLASASAALALRLYDHLSETTRRASLRQVAPWSDSRQPQRSTQ